MQLVLALLVFGKSSMPKNVEVYVTDNAPHARNPPALWTPEHQAAASGPVVRTALKVLPWQLPGGKWAKAVDTSGVCWTTETQSARGGRPAYRFWRKAYGTTFSVHGNRTLAEMGEPAYRQTPEGQSTLAEMGEPAYRQTPAGQSRLAEMGEPAFRQTAQGKRNATESARLLAAHGAGETEDGLTEEQRDALAKGVAAEVSKYTDGALSNDDSAVAYIAVGGWERMTLNLQAAKANGWKSLSICEIFASLLRTTPSVLVLVDGIAQKFTSALIRKVCAEPSLRPALHLSSCNSSPAAPPTSPDPTPPRLPPTLTPTHPRLVTGPGGRPHQGPCLLDAHAQLVHGEGI